MEERLARETLGPLGRRVAVASAVPKGDRAEWLVEKLTEVGASRWIPLRTARSVVHPEGAGKAGRWQRIAQEAARQCGRADDLEILPLTEVGKLDVRGALLASTGSGAMRLVGDQLAADVLVLVGPEGGWEEREEEELVGRGAIRIKLTPTILRVETAAVVAAAMLVVMAGEA